MREFFKSWRRKVGVVTLSLALIFMCGWMRSFVMDDFFPLPMADDADQPTITALAIRNQSLEIYWNSELVMTAQNSEPVPALAAPPALPQASVEFEAALQESPQIIMASASEDPAPNVEPVTLYFEGSEKRPAGDHEQFGDEHFHLLESLPGLTRLFLANTATTDAGLKKLKNLKRLETLALNGTQTTDAGAEDLAELQNLTFLTLGEKTTDAGLKEIKKLNKLTGLNLSHTAITDNGLKDVAELTQLTHLFVGDTTITDQGLEVIGSLTQLSQLYLTNTIVTDAGMKQISRLANLTQLDLSGTNVTDAGLKELAGLKRLTMISLARTKTTKAGTNELKKSLPGLEVNYLE